MDSMRIFFFFTAVYNNLPWRAAETKVGMFPYYTIQTQSDLECALSLYEHTHTHIHTHPTVAFLLI